VGAVAVADQVSVADKELEEARAREQLAQKLAMGEQRSSSPALVMARGSHHDMEGDVEKVHTEEELDNRLRETSGLVVLEVVSSMCRVCRNFLPKYKRVAADYSKVKFLKMTGNENEATRKMASERFNVKKAPYFIFFRNGEIVAEHSGANVERLRNVLDVA
jgi:thioredoxin-like negative regulator of GroEL